jgi:uncharacterized protein YqgC (DUF456 family)
MFREVRPARPAAPVEGRRPRLDGTQRLFLIAFLGSLVFLAWGIVDRSSNQVAVLVAGLLVLALTLASLAVAGAITAYRAAREGKSARAFWAALLGGLVALAAWGCLAAAAVLALLYA